MFFTGVCHSFCPLAGEGEEVDGLVKGRGGWPSQGVDGLAGGDGWPSHGRDGWPGQGRWMA